MTALRLTRAFSDDRTGASGNSALVGTDTADQIYGLSGSDLLYGLSGDDSLFGGGGSDNRLTGAAGDDGFLFGGSGIDTLLGENGNDTLNVASQGELQAGDLFDGGAGVETLLLAAGVSLSAGVPLTSIEVTMCG